MMRWKFPLVIAALLASMTGAVLYYRALYLNAEKDRQHIEAQAISQQAALEQLHRQMQTVAALDAKYTRELERDVAAGRRRLQVRAVCPSVSARAAPGVANAGTARITPDAERDYFRLRAGIETITKQLTGLQQYVREQCLK